VPSPSNRLIHEKSPYLLQHAHNPVDWYPWGEEAFQLAQSANKPIFLSIGYATCHWCHVMERESFCNASVAQVLNDTFVCIKVDREERPEIDGLYMEFAQILMSASAGWPLHVILTPDLKPFYAMTYLPPVNSQGMMGLKETSHYIKKLWESSDREQILAQADEVVDLFKQATAVERQDMPSQHQVSLGAESLLALADTAYGGRKGIPKFPLSYHLEFLMQYAHIHKDPRPLLYIELTLDMMQKGGIYDHLGGGFARYCVDDKWLIPHFEKMLCDNAILVKSYLEGFRVTRRADFQRVAKSTLHYLLKEMQDPCGGFYSAEDADSAGEEGLFYTWTMKEVKKLLDKREYQLFVEFFHLSEEGNFEGRNVLYTSRSIQEYAEEKRESLEEISLLLEGAKGKLLAARELRERPFKDDKMLTSWNALMIESLVLAAQVLEDPMYFQKGLECLAFIKEHLYINRTLLRRYRDREARFEASLNDYAYLIRALLSLFEYGSDNKHLTWAIELTSAVEKQFKQESGAFYFSREAQRDVLVRKCEFEDGAEPAGNSVHADNLIKLARITREKSYIEQAEDVFRSAAEHITQYPESSVCHLQALLHFFHKKALTCIIALDDNRSLEKELKQFFRENYLPHCIILWKREDDVQLLDTLPYMKEYTPIDGQTAVYVCTQEACFQPVLQVVDLAQIISTL